MCTSSIKISAMLRHHCSQQEAPDSIIITDLIQKLIRPSHASLDTYSALMNSNQNQQEMSKKSFLVFQQIILDAHALVGSEQSTFAFLSLSKWKLSCALLSQFKKKTKSCFKWLSDFCWNLPFAGMTLGKKSALGFPFTCLWSFHLNGQLDFLQVQLRKTKVSKKAEMSCHPSFYKEENNKVPILRKTNETFLRTTL